MIDTDVRLRQAVHSNRRSHIMIRKHIIAHGRVQHVGFRFTIMGIASTCKVTGWVKNLYDGNVEIEVQGAAHRVERFIELMKEDRPGGNPWIRISHLDIADIPIVNVLKETGFHPRY